MVCTEIWIGEYTGESEDDSLRLLKQVFAMSLAYLPPPLYGQCPRGLLSAHSQRPGPRELPLITCARPDRHTPETRLIHLQSRSRHHSGVHNGASHQAPRADGLQEDLQVDLERRSREWKLEVLQHLGVQHTKGSDALSLGTRKPQVDCCRMASEISRI